MTRVIIGIGTETLSDCCWRTFFTGADNTAYTDILLVEHCQWRSHVFQGGGLTYPKQSQGFTEVTQNGVWIHTGVVAIKQVLLVTLCSADQVLKSCSWQFSQNVHISYFLPAFCRGSFWKFFPESKASDLKANILVSPNAHAYSDFTSEILTKKIALI